MTSKIQTLTALIPVVCLLTAAFFGISGMKPVSAASGKKAVLVVSFGTTHPDTEAKTIKAVENKIRAAFPDYETRRAFTSRIVIKRVLEKTGVKINTEREALTLLAQEGYREVIVQPLHIVGGEEYEKVKDCVAQFEAANAFDKISLGRPILYYMGQEGKPDDYELAIKAVSSQFPKLKAKEAVVFMGHGGVHPANAAYAALEMRFNDLGFNTVYTCTVEGYPGIELVVRKLKDNKIKKITLMPFLLVAGEHAKNDMAGAEEDSLKSILEKEGFQVEAYLHGLGENPGIQDIYVQHAKDAVESAAK